MQTKTVFKLFILGVLIQFVRYAYKLKYEERPDYGYLRHLLLKILLDKDLVPDSVYDWHE